MEIWPELQLEYPRPPGGDELFAFKKDVLLPILDHHTVASAIILDEQQFVVVRMSTDDVTAQAVRGELETRKAPLFTGVGLASYDPEKDARNRILSANSKLGRQPSPEEFELQVRAFQAFMTEVLPAFTRHYIHHMPCRVHDPWLGSLFVHLQLDSVSIDQGSEACIRGFPYV